MVIAVAQSHCIGLTTLSVPSRRHGITLTDGPDLWLKYGYWIFHSILNFKYKYVHKKPGVSTSSAVAGITLYTGWFLTFATRCYVSPTYSVMRCMCVRPSVCPSVMFARMQEGMKNHDFRPISGFISEMVQDRTSYYGRRIGNRTQAFEWYQFEWPSVRL